MPHFDDAIGRAIARTDNFLRQIEVAKASQVRTRITPRISDRSVDLAYELAYLNVFKEWEQALEGVFIRAMCGYENAAGPPILAAGRSREHDLAAATATLFNGRPYLLWHNPLTVAARAKGYFVNHDIEAVLSSNSSDLENYSNVRHRIAHGQEDSRLKFDVSTMALAGRRYPASSPGRFLRDYVPGVSPPHRWFDEIVGALKSLMAQIAR